MSIEDTDPRLTAYVFGELSDEEKRAFEAELDDDEAAREKLTDIQRTLSMLRAEFADEKPPELQAERRQRITELAGQAYRRTTRRLLWGAGSLGAAAALLFAISLDRRESKQEPPEVSVVEDARAPGESVDAPPLALPSPLRGLAPLKPLASKAVAEPATPGLVEPMVNGFGSIDAFGYSSPAAPAAQARPAPPRQPNVVEPRPPATASVNAGEWDDNANYREFMRWLANGPAPAAHRLDIRDRRFLVVRDSAGMGIPSCRVLITDESDRQTELWTTATGRAILFPHAEGLTGRELTATAECAGGASKRFFLAGADGIVDLRTTQRRDLPAQPLIDVAFVLDSTGSMSEEIASVKNTIQKVASGLRNANVLIRIGLIEFKDRGDPFVTRVFPMSTDLGRFSAEVASVQASGGGDTPESVNEALHAGLEQLAWDQTALAKLAFLVGDAPPHLDYPQDYDYALEARGAARRGIQVYTVAASGMDTLGQVVWRQVAQYTGATNLFVLRGGAGPQSVGAGDPKSSCGGTQTAYTSGNLDALVLAKIKGAIRALERDPMRIPGLNTDENAKPCADRVTFTQ